MPNINEDILELITSSTGELDYSFSEGSGDYIRLSLFTQGGDFVDYFYSPDDITLYDDPDDNNFIPHLKPSEILDINSVPQGNYRLQFDFYRDTIQEIITSSGTVLLDNAKYTITEISPSRKEVRIIVKTDNDGFNQDGFDSDLDDRTFAEHLEDSFLSNSSGEPSSYQFHHVLNITRGRNILITNYQFDTTTDNTTLILRLYSPLPSDVVRFNEVEINRELVQQQTQDIFYVSNVRGVVIGDGLTPDTESFANVITQDTDNQYQDFNDLYESGSFDENTSDIISASISNSDVNLNVDFSKFENHVFFGSAVSKLENFRTKVIEIENHLVELSSSLIESGSHIFNRRQELFNKIQNVKNNFTPYERFMFNDNQFTATSSAPGIGKNLAPSMPVTMSSDQANGAILSNFEGFKTIYKHTTEGASQNIQIFHNKYFAHKAPFFNFSGSVFLSFLMRADDELTSGGGAGKLGTQNNNVTNNDNITGVQLPSKAFHIRRLLNPSANSGSYRRLAFIASQSFWRPTSVVDYNIGDIIDWSDSSNEYVILSGSGIPTGSAVDNNPITSPVGYDTFPSIYSGSVVNENTEFSGSCMPMGELFRIGWDNPNGAGGPTTSSFITDIKVTLKNPLNALPFSNLYSTGSSEWTSWYDGMVSSASLYDEENIHSLQNNLPDNIREDSDSTDLKTFLHMIGEHFDLLRNYIDNYSNFYKRKYKTIESTPTNLLPILGDNLGWEFINPFSSSLAEYFADNSFDNNVQQIGEATWRKTLNNLIYIYKSKGTLNSVRALLNIYGYSPDLLQLSEYGGSTEESNPAIITNDNNPFKQGFKSTTGNVGFVNETRELYTVNLRGTNKLNFDWWTNNANGDCIEFIFSSPKTITNQTLVESSGSGGETMWDISLITSASNSTKGKLQFRLNNSLTGSLPIASNAVSMSTDFYSLKNTSLWNVMLQRMTASLSSKITQSYQLSVGLQKEDKITELQTISMSVHNPLTNVNFISGSSLDITSSTAVSGNLVFGESFSGSMSEIRLWSGSLSQSKFKQHVLNKFSVVGNDENGFKNRIWHFKLNENDPSGSIGKSFIDANLNYFKDYSISHSLSNDGRLYNKRLIEIFKLNPRIDINNQRNNNKIIIDPEDTMIFNLSPLKKSLQTIYEKSSDKGKKRINTSKIDIIKSPADVIDKYITNNLSDFDLTGKIGHPNSAKFSSSYKELDDLRETLMDGVKVDVNEYIDGQKNIFNSSIIDGVRRIIPVRSTIDSVGVLIKPDFLQRAKYTYGNISIHTGSDAGVYDATLLDYWTHVDASSTSSYVHNLSGSSFIQPQESNIDYINTYVNFTQSNFVSPFIDTIDVNNVINLSSSDFQSPFTSSVNYIETYVNFTESTFVQPNNFNININNDIINFTGSDLKTPFSSSINYINDYVNITQSYIAPYDVGLYSLIDDIISLTNSKFEQPVTSSVNYIETYVDFNESAFVNPFTGSNIGVNIDYINLSGSNFQSPFTSNIDYIETYINFSESKFEPPFSSSVNVNSEYVNLSESKFQSPFNLNINYVETYINLSESKFESPFTSSIKYVDNHLSFSESKFISPFTSSIDYIETYVNLSESALIKPNTGSIENFVIPGGNGTGLDLQGNSYKKGPNGETRTRLIDTWGTSSNDTHFLPYTDNPHAAGVHDDFNTAYYDSVVLIHTIGDREELSGSRNLITAEFSTDFTDENNHKGRLIIDQGLGYTYKTYVGSGSFAGVSGAPIDGRPMGRTAYFSASSNGNITYPANHFVNFPTSKEGISSLTYDGTLNGVSVKSIKKDGSGNLIDIIPDEQDPLYLVGGKQVHKLGWDSEFDQFMSASSFAVYKNNVGGSDTDTVLKVIRNT